MNNSNINDNSSASPESSIDRSTRSLIDAISSTKVDGPSTGSLFTPLMSRGLARRAPLQNRLCFQSIHVVSSLLWRLFLYFFLMSSSPETLKRSTRKPFFTSWPWTRGSSTHLDNAVREKERSGESQSTTEVELNGLMVITRAQSIEGGLVGWGFHGFQGW